MAKPYIALVILTMGLAVASLAQARRGAVTPIAPMITSTSIDNSQRQLTIKGQNFGRTPPGVILGDSALRVQQSTHDEILAELPAGMKKATYRLIVTTGSALRVNSDPFFTTVLTDAK